MTTSFLCLVRAVHGSILQARSTHKLYLSQDNTTCSTKMLAGKEEDNIHSDVYCAVSWQTTWWRLFLSLDLSPFPECPQSHGMEGGREAGHTYSSQRLLWSCIPSWLATFHLLHKRLPPPQGFLAGHITKITYSVRFIIDVFRPSKYFYSICVYINYA